MLWNWAPSERRHLIYHAFNDHFHAVELIRFVKITTTTKVTHIYLSGIISVKSMGELSVSQGEIESYQMISAKCVGKCEGVSLLRNFKFHY